ncbi:MAG: A/G-specific adenine glycosylase [Candidatus Hodarchaeales archaeon]
MKKDVYESEIQKEFASRLLDWYKEHKRELPWRKTTDPYKIIVSEIMLHQTTVSTVIPVYKAFIKKFPTIKTVAKAELSEIKKISDPLGYKRRGQYIKQICELIVMNYDGEVPKLDEELLALPGIGKYSSGAIRSFAFNIDAPVVDTNVQRVLNRIFFIDITKLTGAKLEKEWWRLATLILPKNQARNFNNAIMDLGSMICIPGKPKCIHCPVSIVCRFYMNQPKQKRLLEFFDESV